MSVSPKFLKERINSLRELRKHGISSETMPVRDLFYINEGYKEGLCSAAMMLDDELDALTIDDPQDYMEAEEEWWHSDDNLEERL